MTATQLQFLDDRLSSFRAEYLPQIDRNLPELLAAFDAHVLEGGHSDEAEARFKTHPSYEDVILSDPNIFRGVEDRPVYEKLSSALGKLQGEARQAFLYGLRKALVTAQTFVNGQETRMGGLQETTEALIEAKERVPKVALDISLGVLYDQGLRLRGASSGYRDVYRVMVDAVRQALPK